MEVVSFLAGLILGIMALDGKRLLFLFKVILSLYISFLLLRFSDKSIYLWTFHDYTDKSLEILLNQSFLKIGVIYAIASYIFFYTILPRVINKVFINEEKAKKFYSEMIPTDKLAIIGLTNRLISWYFKKFPPHEKVSEQNDLTYNKYKYYVLHYTCFSVNAIIVSLFVLGFDNIMSYIISMFILAFCFMMMKFIPIYLHARKEIYDIINESVNKHVV